MTTTLQRPPASRLENGPEPILEREAMSVWSWGSPSGLWHRRTSVIAALSIVAIVLHLLLRFGFNATTGIYRIPLLSLSRERVVAFQRSVLLLGVLGRERLQYWKLLLWTAWHRPRMVPLAVELAIFGHHFRRIFEQQARRVALP